MNNQTTYVCHRYYLNGDRVETKFTNEAEKDNWIEYNSTYRFGQSLFVDGEVAYKGYHSDEQCETISQNIRKEISSTPSKPSLSRR